MPNSSPRPRFPSTRSTICWLVALFLCAACSSYKTVEETHTTHVVDYGQPLADGIKVASETPVAFVLYKDGAVAGTGEQAFNGMMVLPPSRYWTLLATEATLADLAGAAVDGKLAAEVETLAASIAAQLQIAPAAARDVAFGRLVKQRLAAADAKLRPVR